MSEATAENGKSVAMVWAAVLVGPLAWFGAFGILFWLTRPVCESGDRVPMALVSAIAAMLVAGGLVVGARIARVEVGAAASLRFLARLAVWGNAIFLLAIALMSVPISLLSPCGV